MKFLAPTLLLFTLLIYFPAHAEEDWLKLNLLRKQQHLRDAVTVDELLEMEKAELKKLTYPEKLAAADAITPKQAQRLLNSITPHPVVGMAAYDSYNREN